MDTIPFHWDTLAAPQCLVMACLYPDECHEDLVLRNSPLWDVLLQNLPLLYMLYGCLVLQRIISANVDHGTATGINALRRLKIKRCGELDSRLSSHLTFAYVCVAIRAIHSSRRGISAWSLVQIT